MEPILPEPVAQNNYENAPNAPIQPVNTQASTETAPNVAPDQTREVSQASASQPVTPLQSIEPVVPIATPSPTVVAQDNTLPTADPLIADDVDVIEKEWVDKAKQIVSATKADPHLQEKEVSKLQADYLLKRYNKIVKLTE